MTIQWNEKKSNNNSDHINLSFQDFSMKELVFIMFIVSELKQLFNKGRNSLMYNVYITCWPCITS